MTITFKTKAIDADKRLDVFLSENFPQFSRNNIQNLIKEKKVLVNSKPQKASHKIKENDKIELEIPKVEETKLTPQDLPFEILFEDNDIIVVNKPAGLTVHPGAGRKDNTLANALLYHTTHLSSVGGPLRPGIVHRLDKDTSGVLLVAKTNEAHLKLLDVFKTHDIKRIYHAIVWGSPKEDAGVINMDIGRDEKNRKKISTNTRKKRTAITKYKVLKRYEYVSLLELTLETGRTHQIRVHLENLKTPVIGDQTYGKRIAPFKMKKEIADYIKKLKRQMLHAKILGFTHPMNNKDMEFESSYPEDMKQLLEKLENEANRK